MDSKQKRGSTLFDLLAEDKRLFYGIVIFVGILIVIGVLLLGYITFHKGATISYKDFKAQFGGPLDSLAEIEKTMTIVKDVCKQIADKSSDPKIKYEYSKISTEASIILIKANDLRDNLLQFNKQTDPKIQEQILKDVLENYGVSQKELASVNLGIVDKYVESQNLKDELRNLRNEAFSKDRKIEDLQATNRNLRDRLQTMKNDAIVVKDKAYQQTLDSLQRVLNINDSIARENNKMRTKLDSSKPFLIETFHVGLPNVGTTVTEEYKGRQIRSNDIQLSILFTRNSGYDKPIKSSYDVVVEVNYYSSKTPSLQRDRFTINIPLGEKLNKKITLQKDIGRGRVFVTVYYEKEKIYDTDFVVGKKSIL